MLPKISYTHIYQHNYNLQVCLIIKIKINEKKYL